MVVKGEKGRKNRGVFIQVFWGCQLVLDDDIGDCKKKIYRKSRSNLIKGIKQFIRIET